MCSFNDLIRYLGIIDVNLENRDFTWSNKRPAPVFSKLDRVLFPVNGHWFVLI